MERFFFCLFVFFETNHAAQTGWGSQATVLIMSTKGEAGSKSFPGTPYRLLSYTRDKNENLHMQLAQKRQKNNSVSAAVPCKTLWCRYPSVRFMMAYKALSLQASHLA